MQAPVLRLAVYLQVARIALFALVAIIITGSLVRLTGSGLGCVDWPACNDERFVDVSSGHAAIEQVNRLFTGVVAAAVIAAVLSALAVRPRVLRLIWLSVGLVVGVLAQVVVGGIVVLTGLNPWSNMAHFLISIVLVSVAVLLIHETRISISGRAPLRPTSSKSPPFALGIVVLASLVTVLGTVVTATGPHAGDENAVRFTLDLSSVVRLHAVAVWAFLALIVTVAVVVRREGSTRLIRLTEFAIAWSIAQGLIGYVQYFSGVPVFLVALHVAGSVFVWMASLKLSLELIRPVPEMG
jgi:cytochrome c oxidase assembly protein subunit 15